MRLLDFLKSIGLETDKVVNKHFSNNYDLYIGRPSKWGNPIYLKDKSDYIERLIVLIKYCEYLKEQDELLNLIDKEIKNKILGCYCSPSLCHGFILNTLSNSSDKTQTLNEIIKGLGLELNKAKQVKIKIGKVENSPINVYTDKVEGKIYTGDKVEGRIIIGDKIIDTKKKNELTDEDFIKVVSDVKTMNKNYTYSIYSPKLKNKVRNKIYEFLDEGQEEYTRILTEAMNQTKEQNDRFINEYGKELLIMKSYLFPRFLFVAFPLEKHYFSAICNLDFTELDEPYKTFLNQASVSEFTEHEFINYMASRTFQEAGFQNYLDFMMIYEFTEFKKDPKDYNEKRTKDTNVRDVFYTMPRLINILVSSRAKEAITEGTL